MQDWVGRMKKLGAQVDGEGIITQLAPDEAALSKCFDLGKRLVG
jgi:hypothetical protein